MQASLDGMPGGVESASCQTLFCECADRRTEGGGRRAEGVNPVNPVNSVIRCIRGESDRHCHEPV